MNKRKGISLIVLVITILVMIILAGVVVVSLQKNNPIEKAKTAKDTSNLSALKEELELYKTNELMQGNKDANNISFTETEVKDILKNIPDNLKGKVVVSNGKLGVGYSKITEEARDYARENDIFDAEDKIAPDADIYVENANGRKYVKVDAVDYESDISRITSNDGQTFIPNIGYEKIGYFAFYAKETKEDLILKNLKKDFKNVEVLTEVKDLNNYNVVVLYGGHYFNPYGNMTNPDIANQTEYALVDFFESGTEGNGKYIITSGNDSWKQTSRHSIFETTSKPVECVSTLVKNPNVTNNITRQIDEWKDKEPSNKSDGQRGVKFKSNVQVYYTNSTAPVEHENNIDSIGMYLDNSKGWFHMQNGPIHTEKYKKDSYYKTYKAAITKMTGSRTMKIDVTGVTPGTKYSFTITDFAGNTVIKEIML